MHVFNNYNQNCIMHVHVFIFKIMVTNHAGIAIIIASAIRVSYNNYSMQAEKTQ